MNSIFARPLHVAINFTSAALIAVPEEARAPLLANAENLARTFHTVWAVHNLDDSLLPEISQEGQIARFGGVSPLGVRGHRSLLNYSQVIILSGLEAELHIVASVLSAISAGRYPIVAADAVWYRDDSSRSELGGRLFNHRDRRGAFLSTEQILAGYFLAEETLRTASA